MSTGREKTSILLGCHLKLHLQLLLHCFLEGRKAENEKGFRGSIFYSVESGGNAIMLNGSNLLNMQLLLLGGKPSRLKHQTKINWVLFGFDSISVAENRNIFLRASLLFFALWLCKCGEIEFDIYVICQSL